MPKELSAADEKETNLTARSQAINDLARNIIASLAAFKNSDMKNHNYLQKALEHIDELAKIPPARKWVFLTADPTELEKVIKNAELKLRQLEQRLFPDLEKKETPRQ